MSKDTYFCSVLTSITYKNIQISFSDEGKGSAVILLHGFLENSTMWNAIVPEISKQNRVINIDLLGHGKTDCLGYTHSMDAMAEMVQFVLKSLRIRRVTLVGHSMGGYVALAFAELYPNYVKGICLLNSTAQADSEERKQIRLRAIQMAQTNYKSLVSMSIANLFAKSSREFFFKEIEVVKKEALKTSVQGYIACSEGMRLRPNREHVLLSNDFKKLLVFGENDPILQLQLVVDEAQRTKTELRQLSGGHMSHIENKTEVIEVLKGFLKTKL